MELEHITDKSTTEHKTKRNGFRPHSKHTLFVGILLVLVVLGIVRLIGDVTNKKSTLPHAATAMVAGTHTADLTAALSATSPSQPSPILKQTPTPQPSRLPKQTFLPPNLTPMESGKYYKTSTMYCVGKKCFAPPPLVNGAADPPALDITGYPGMDKVIINASLKTTDKELLFTNNESQDWKLCYANINTDAGPGKWYEYDFSGIPAGQSQIVQWSQLLRKDGTPYTNVSNEPKIIQLSCVLDDNYDAIGFAKFHYSSLGVAQQE